MKRHRQCFLMTLTAVAVLLPTHPIRAQSYTHARIVRLSFVEGEVTVQRPEVAAWSQAPINTPLQEGFKLATGENSFAEVEFENGGTARLGQQSLLDFTELGLTEGGGKINHLQLEQGYATFHFRVENDADSFEVATPADTVTAQQSAMFRMELDQDVERVEVFEGTVQVSSNTGSLPIEAGMAMELRLGSDEPPSVSEGITKDDWDNWVDDREARMAVGETGPPPNDVTAAPPVTLYGWSDLGAYGSWSYVPGWGYGWIPTVATGWAPYTHGQWCWYHGLGFTWISAEPWGWVPYHYGDWGFVGELGWTWFPGNFATWSPAPVNWYSGPGWVGWTPRLHPIHGSPLPKACAGANCGGGAMSMNSFRNGKTVDSTTLLGYHPTTGVQISQPKVRPTMAMMLPGQVLKEPPAAGPRRPIPRGNPPAVASTTHGNNSTQAKAAGSGSLGASASVPHGRTMEVPNTSIVYDSEEHQYVNKPRGIRPQEPAFKISPTSNSGASGSTSAEVKAGSLSVVQSPSQQPAPAPAFKSTGQSGFPASVSAPRAIAGPRGNFMSHIPSPSPAGPSASSAKAPATPAGGASPSHAASGGSGVSGGQSTGGGGGRGATASGGSQAGSGSVGGGRGGAASGGGHAGGGPTGGGRR